MLNIFLFLYIATILILIWVIFLLATALQRKESEKFILKPKLNLLYSISSTTDLKVDVDGDKPLNPLQELVSTERIYLHQLQLLNETFRIPLIEKKILTSKKAENVFSNCDELIVYHYLLLQGLETAAKNNASLSSVILNLVIIKF